MIDIDDYIGKIINADCMDILKQLPDKCIDLVLTDPPYNIGIADWDKWKNQNDYINWLGSIFKECQRVLKDNGSFYFFHNNFLQIVELQNYINKNTDFIFKQFIVWNKKFYGAKKEGFLQGYNELLNSINYQKFAEYLLFYVKEYAPIYLKNEFIRAKVSNNDISKLFPSKTGRLTGRVSNWLNGSERITKKQYLKIRDFLGSGFLVKDYEDLYYTFNNQKTHHSVWDFNTANKMYNKHLTPKPVILIENILKYSSNENDLILDCFSGSGTTAVACHNLKRRFICIEKDYDYWKASCRRLQIEQNQARIF